MAQGIFIAEVISDSIAYGGGAQNALKNITSFFGGGGDVPIGTVEWRAGGDPSLPSVTGFAAPLMPHTTTIPLVGEYILVIVSPAPTQGGSTSAESFFYIGPINLDGDKNNNKAGGLFSRDTDGSSIDLPKLPPNFPEKPMPPIQPLVGDTIFQDRNGCVIRMSSSPLSTSTPSFNLGSKLQMPWSKTGGVPRSKKGPSYYPKAAGNPIMALTVGTIGQSTGTGTLGSIAKTKTFGENIDTDRTSLYMSSDQVLNFSMVRPFNHTADNQPLGQPVKFSTDGANKAGNGATNAGDAVGGDPQQAAYAAEETYNNPAAGKTEFALLNLYPGQVSTATSQGIFRSDRIIIDARADSCLITGNKDVKIGTKNWRMEVNSTMDLIHETLKQNIILTQQCEELATALHNTLELIKTIQFPTGVGPTGPCLDAYLKTAEAIQKKLGDPTNKKDTTYGYLDVRAKQYFKLLQEFDKQRRSESDIKDGNKALAKITSLVSKGV